MLGTYVAIPGAIFAAFKTLQELKLLREQRARERLSRVHERQLEILGALYARLEKVQAYSQLMTKSAIFEGERTEEYPALLSAAFSEARSEFMSARLFLPIQVVKKVESFFEQGIKGQVHLGLALRAEISDGANGATRAAFWTEAATIAHKGMPSLLEEIENEAREIIHGESGPNPAVQGTLRDKAAQRP